MTPAVQVTAGQYFQSVCGYQMKCEGCDDDSGDHCITHCSAYQA